MDEIRRLIALDKLIAEQKKDDKSRHVPCERDGGGRRVITMNPQIMAKIFAGEEIDPAGDGTALEEIGLRYDSYHGWCKDDM